MPDTKILKFIGGATTTRQEHRRPTAPQRELILNPDVQRGKAVFLSIDETDQGRLFALLTRNAVFGIVDIRSVPVFEKPRFRHKEIADYLASRPITYLHFYRELIAAVSFRPAGNSFTVGDRRGREDLAARINLIRRALLTGLLVVLYDASPDVSEIVLRMRALLRSFPEFSAELNPRALLV